MKTTLTLAAQPRLRRQSVKKLLIYIIIRLTSEKVFTFASVVGSAIAVVGSLLDDRYVVAAGASVFIFGFAPWGLRRTCRDIRQDRIGRKIW